MSKCGVISGPYFPVFGLNTEIYSVNLPIQSEYRKIRTRNNSVFGHFSHSDAIKTASKRVIQKTAEATGELIGNKITDRIKKVSKTLPNNNSETNKEEILRERFIPPELRYKIIGNLRLI